MNKDIQTITAFDQEISLLRSISSLLEWDQNTILPAKAFADRAQQVSYIRAKIHSKETDPKLTQAIEHLKKHKSKLSFPDQALLRVMDRSTTIARSIPESHVRESAKAHTASFEAWIKARKANDFSIFSPHLEKVIDLKRKEARYINAKEDPYQVHVDLFEEDMTLAQLDQVFSQLRDQLIPLITAITNSSTYKKQKDLLKSVPFNQEGEWSAAKEIAALILSSKERTYLGESIHPFTSQISGDDVRLTIALRKGQPMFSFTSASHESGHALYDLDINPKLKNSILCDGPSLGIHESQSRIWENHITLSKPFWQFYYKKYQHHLPAFKTIPSHRFYQQINNVKPGVVRLEADEVTYCLHIIIRYEIEKALLSGNLKVKDLPKAWTSLYQKYLGVSPKDDLAGVLQDVHWTDGSFGYFPTYALGTIYSSMIYAAIKKEHPHIEEDIAKGNFDIFKKWLKNNIHTYGSTKKTKEIIENACKKKITTLDFIEYLSTKYTHLYKIK